MPILESDPWVSFFMLDLSVSYLVTCSHAQLCIPLERLIVLILDAYTIMTR